MSEHVIEALELTKRYGDAVAVDRVSFRIARGEIVGFLGPNGAGKTTTLRMLAGFLPPTAGTARILGHDVMRSPREAKRWLGYLPERPPLYPEMTVAQYLRFLARVKGLGWARGRSEVDRVLALADVAAVAGRLIGHLSRGYQQRVGLAQALLGEPAILLLDEPTLGLDPNQMQFVRTLVRGLARDRTVFLSTHFLYEVEEVCSRVFVIHDGRLVADAPLAELTAASAGGARLVVGVGSTDEGVLRVAAALLAEIPGVRTVQADPSRPGRFVVSGDGGPPPRSEIAERLVAASIPLDELTPVRPRLEEVFRELTGQAPEGGARVG